MREYTQKMLQRLMFDWYKLRNDEANDSWDMTIGTQRKWKSQTLSPAALWYTICVQISAGWASKSPPSESTDGKTRFHTQHHLHLSPLKWVFWENFKNLSKKGKTVFPVCIYILQHVKRDTWIFSICKKKPFFFFKKKELSNRRQPFEPVSPRPAKYILRLFQ